ncbi:MAG: hypothetical protein IT357_04750, partial [Gemmatimonadaceae bacterium]|nr:hypothetical protein [Gemmatimonadaceae bacterium]
MLPRVLLAATLSVSLSPRGADAQIDPLCAVSTGLSAVGTPTSPLAGYDVVLVHGFVPSDNNPLALGVPGCLSSISRDASDYWGIGEVGQMNSLVESLLMNGVRVWVHKWQTQFTMSEAAIDLRIRVRSLVANGQMSTNVVLVGHSMGGVVSLSALSQGSGLRDVVKRVVTLSSPHRGTNFGALLGFVGSGSVAQVIPGGGPGSFLEQLLAARTSADDAMTYLVGGEVGEGYACPVWGLPVYAAPGGDDCVVPTNSAYDLPARSGSNPNRLRIPGASSYFGYDHSQIGLDYANRAPYDASGGNALLQLIYQLVLQDQAPRIAPAVSEVRLSAPNLLDASVGIANSGAFALPFIGLSARISAGGGDWLTTLAVDAAPSGSAVQANLRVVVNPTGLSPGEYRAVVELSATRAASVQVPVILTVPQQGAPVLSASAASVDAGVPFTLSWTEVPAATSYTLERSRDRSYTDLAPYIVAGTSRTDAIPLSGSNPVTLYYRVRANNSLRSNEVSVTAVPAPPTGMSAAPSALTLTGLVGGGTVSADLTLRLDGVTSFTWCVVGVVPAGTGNFLEFPSSCGNQSTLPIQVRANPARTAGEGTYTGTVEIRSPQTSNMPLLVPVTFDVRDGSSSGIDLVVENAYVDYAYHDPRVEGASPAASIRYYWNVKNIGTNSLAANATTYGRTTVYWGTSRDPAEICRNSNNLRGNVLNRTTAIAAGGTKLEFETDQLPAAAYTVGESFLMFHVDGDWDSGVCLGLPGLIGETNENNNVLIVPIYIPRPAAIGGLASTVSLSGGFGETATATLPFTNSGDRALVVQASSSDPRITVTVLSDRILLQTSTAAWPPGTSSATLSVTSNGGNATVPVQVVVAARPLITLSQSTVDLTTRTAAQGELAISNGGGSTLAWTVASSAGWLTALPASGVNAGTVAWTADPAGLIPGTYTATLQVSAAYAENSPATVTVN